MRGVSNLNLRQLNGMSLHQLIDFIEEQGYSTEAMSNDEMFDLAVSILDGHEEEGDIEDLDFSDQGARGLARFMEENRD